jgi:hypothetical protein
MERVENGHKQTPTVSRLPDFREWQQLTVDFGRRKGMEHFTRQLLIPANDTQLE